MHIVLASFALSSTFSRRVLMPPSPDARLRINTIQLGIQAILRPVIMSGIRRAIAIT